MRQVAQGVDDDEADLAGAGAQGIDAGLFVSLTTARWELFDQLAWKMCGNGVAAEVGCGEQRIGRVGFADGLLIAGVTAGSWSG